MEYAELPKVTKETCYEHDWQGIGECPECVDEMVSGGRMTDLIERLREAHANSQQRIYGSDIFAEAADEIERLRKRVAELEAREQRPDWLSQALNEGDGVYRP